MIPGWETKFYRIMTEQLLNDDDPLVVADKPYMIPPPNFTAQPTEPISFSVVIQESLDEPEQSSSGQFGHVLTVRLRCPGSSSFLAHTTGLVLCNL